MKKEKIKVSRWRKLLQENTGFTMVEMIVVLFVIGVVMMIVLPNLRAAGDKAQLTTCEANQRLIRTQLENYYMENGHTYPAAGDGEENKQATNILTVLKDNQYLQSVPTCPSDEDPNDDRSEYVITYPPQETAGNAFTTATVKCNIHGELGADDTVDGS